MKKFTPESTQGCLPDKALVERNLTIILMHVCGLSYRKIAKEMGLHFSTVEKICQERRRWNLLADEVINASLHHS